MTEPAKKEPARKDEPAKSAPAKKMQVKTKPAGEKKPGKPRFPMIFCVLFTLLLLVLAWTPTFVLMDARWGDFLFRMRGVERADSRVVVVAIDDESLKEVGSYPWPRGVYKKLLDNMYEAGVKVVGLDIMFFDPSPQPDQDQILVDSTKRHARTLIHAMRAHPKTGTTKLEYVYPFEKLHKAVEQLASVSQLWIDSDGFVRATQLFVSENGYFDEALSDESRMPSLGLRLLSIYSGKSVDEIAAKVGTNKVQLNIRGEEVITKLVEIDGKHEFVEAGVNHGITRISAADIIRGTLNTAEKETLKGAMVLVGSTASGAYDHFPNAFSDANPGVEVHATLVDNLLNDRWMRYTSPLLVLVFVILMVIVARVLVDLRPLFAGLGFIGMVVAWLTASVMSFKSYVLLEFTAPLVALTGTFLTLMVYRAMLEYAQKREVRQMFGQYVAPEVVDILVQDPSALKLGGQKRDMTMFFLDIAHFTTISEKMPPENLIQFLNHYLTALTDDVLGNNGVVDKYIGDCIMAFWNAPLSEPDHRRKACLAAVDCVETIKRLNVDYVDETIPEKPAVRIGLNSGEVVVGNTGSARKLAYTVLGDEVNLASRLEGANKFFGSTVMASEDTFKGAKDAVVGRFLGKVRVVGKDIPIGVYELLGRKGKISKEWQEALPVYTEAVELYGKREFEKAKELFEKVVKIVPNDKPTKLYLNVCEDYVTIPPQDDWEPVFNLTSK